MRHCTEDDVVTLFGTGLGAFIKLAGGTFASRRVTLRQEKSYPSDQDYVLQFGSSKGFNLHLFGLQFKRWKTGGWKLQSQQIESLRKMEHVVGYCLPRDCWTVPSNALHAFYFVNPSCVPQGCSSIRVERGFPSVSSADHDENWAHIRTCVKLPGGQDEDSIPRLGWGEFFDQVAEGAIILPVPGDPANPPASTAPPRDSDVRVSSGIGLTVTCTGSWGSAWARRQISDHVRFWARSVLSPPAAVIAFESFSRSIEFIEVTP